jgi:ribosomal protein S18 acetylase RimI-like enzyme
LTNRVRNTAGGKTVKARIRKFEVSDTDSVLALAERYASWDATPTKADIEGFHSFSPEFFLVAEADQKILGFVYGRESNPPAEVLDKWRSGKVASIETLAVEQDYRRQGIATSLLTALFEAFKEKGIDLVILSVPVVEIAAMRLYGKMGFEPRAQFLWKRLAT